MAKDVKVQIVGDATKFKSALQDASTASDKFSKQTKSNGDEMSKFGLGALAVGGAIGVGLFKAGEAASDLGESINAVQVTFGKSAAGILKLGEDAATAVGLSNTAFNGLAVQFSSFATTIAGKGGDVVSTMKEMTGRAADFASVMNIEVADAAAIFQSGLAGETEPLKKFGIDLSAAAVSAYAAANGIGETGKQLTEAEKVTARYGLLMEQTAKTQGDFANTSDSAANATRIAKAEFENAAASLGSVVAPVMAEVASKAAMLAKGFVSLNEATGGALIGFTAFVGGGALLLGTVTSIIGRVQKMQAAFHDSNGDLTKTGSLMKGLVPIAAVATVAFFGLSQRANHAADAIKHITENAEELGSAADKDVLNVLNKSIAQGISNGVSLAETMKTLADTNLEGAKRALELAEANGTNATVVAALRQAILDEEAAVAQSAKTTAEFTTATDESTAATDGMTVAQLAAKGAVEGIAQATEEATRKSDAFAESIRHQREKLDDLYGVERSAVTAKYDFAESSAQAMIATDALNTALASSRTKQEDLESATNAAKDAIFAASEDYATLEGAALDSEGGIRRQIESLKSQADALAPGSPLRLFLDQYIADLERIPSNISTRLGLSISSDATNTNAPGYGTPGQRRAGGGPVEAGQLYVVGENGEELFVPEQDGQIINARQTGQIRRGSKKAHALPIVVPQPGDQRYVAPVYGSGEQMPGGYPELLPGPQPGDQAYVAPASARGGASDFDSGFSSGGGGDTYTITGPITIYMQPGSTPDDMMQSLAQYVKRNGPGSMQKLVGI